MFFSYILLFGLFGAGLWSRGRAKLVKGHKPITILAFVCPMVLYPWFFILRSMRKPDSLLLLSAHCNRQYACASVTNRGRVTIVKIAKAVFFMNLPVAANNWFSKRIIIPKAHPSPKSSARIKNSSNVSYQCSSRLGGK